MILLPCPWCGPRNVTEFQHRARPPAAPTWPRPAPRMAALPLLPAQPVGWVERDLVPPAGLPQVRQAWTAHRDERGPVGPGRGRPSDEPARRGPGCALAPAARRGDRPRGPLAFTWNGRPYHGPSGRHDRLGAGRGRASGCSPAASSTTARAACSRPASTTRAAWSRSATSPTSAAPTGWSTGHGGDRAEHLALTALRRQGGEPAGRTVPAAWLLLQDVHEAGVPLARLREVLRRFVHAGAISPDTPHGHYDKRYAHPDVLIAGGGPAGMAAALAAARAGARVLLVEEEHQLGGHLRWGGPGGAGRPAGRAARRAEGIEVLTDSVVLGRYDEQLGRGAAARPPGVAERLIKARASARRGAGLIERPYVFAGNDLPGVMLSTAVRRLINLYAVKPGDRAVVLTANAAGDAAIADLKRAGVEVVRVVDARRGDDVAAGARPQPACGPSSSPTAPDRLRPARHRGRLDRADLAAQHGRRPARCTTRARRGSSRADGCPMTCSRPAASPGDGTPGRAGRARGRGRREAARRAAARRCTPPRRDPHPATAAARPSPGRWPRHPELPVDQHPELFRGTTHGIVDSREDVSSKDSALAVAGGLRLGRAGQALHHRHHGPGRRASWRRSTRSRSSPRPPGARSPRPAPRPGARRTCR